MLILAALGLTLALTLAGMSFSHMTVSTKLSSGAHARALAEAAIAKGTERLSSTQGKAFTKYDADADGNLNSPTVEITMPNLESGVGRLTFDSDVAEDWNLPVSTQNYRGVESVEGGGGRVVPRKSVHFVSEGKYRGTTHRLEVIVHVPTYEDPLSSEGPISSPGPLFVASAESLADALKETPDYSAGGIASNSSDSGIHLDGSGINITGSARSVGDVVVQGGAQVHEERPNSDPVELPELDLRDFDPANFGKSQLLKRDISDNLLSDQNVNGLCRETGDIEIDSLTFPAKESGAGGLLWIDGNITINGNFTGTGALFATGNITINKAGQSSVDLDAGSNMAVVAGKELTIKGRGGTPESAVFTGVLMSGSDANISGISVVGTFTSGNTKLDGNSLGTDSPEVTLTNVDLVHVSDEVHFEFKYPFLGGTGGADMGVPGFNIVGPDGQPDKTIPGVNVQGKDGTGDGGDAMYISHFFNPDTENFELTPSEWSGFGKYKYNEANHTREGSPFGFKKKTDQEFVADEAELRAYYETEVLVGGRQILYGGEFYPSFQALKDAKNVSFSDLVQTARNQFFALRQQEIVLANKWYDEHFGQSKENGTFTMDPNEFVQWDGAARIRLWRDL